MAQDLKILLFDIETTDLEADFGRLLCMGYKWYGEKKVHLITEDQYRTTDKFGMICDRGLAEACRNVLEQADVWFTWFGMYFDVPFINSRLLKHKLTPLPTSPHAVRHIDGWKLARKNLKLKSNRLDRVARHIGAKAEKTIVAPEIWLQAAHGHRPSLKYIYDHCEKDILVLEDAFEALRPFMTLMPHQNLVVQGKEGCPRCGSKKLQRRGYRYSLLRRYQRYQCTKCGSWAHGAPEKVDNVTLR